MARAPGSGSEAPPQDWPRRRVCLAAVAGSHGVRGLVRLKTFTQVPEDALSYGPLRDEAGTRVFRLSAAGRAKDLLVAAIEGVRDRDAAAALRGTRLYVERDRLPPPEAEDEFYHADLLGLVAVAPDGRELGRVRAVYDFGAGDLLEIVGPDGRPLVVPFTKAAVPQVDIAGGRVTVDPPVEVGGEEMEEGGSEDPAGTGQDAGKAP